MFEINLTVEKGLAKEKHLNSELIKPRRTQ